MTLKPANSHKASRRRNGLAAGSLTAALSLALAACGSSSPPKAASTSAPSNSTTPSSASATSSTAASAPSASTKGTINVGMVITTSGGSASIGVPDVNAAKLAIANINKSGGLLGHKVNLIVRDDGGSVSTAVSELQKLISSDHVVAMFGPDNSAVAVAEASILKSTHIPFVLDAANDISLTTKDLSPTTVQIVPNTIMEPTAVAHYIQKHFARSGTPIRLALVAPNYNFGVDSIKTLQSALTALHVKYTVVAKDLPSPKATSFSQYMPGLVSAHPTIVFSALFGGGLITFTKEAAQSGLLKNSHIISYYGINVLSQLPSGVAGPQLIGLNRAPFSALPGAKGDAVVSSYHTAYHTWPSEFALYVYAGVQTWAAGVRNAKTTTGTTVVNALLGHSVPTILGSYKIRSCDHQELAPEFFGTVSSTKSAKYGVYIDSNITTVPGSATALSCSAAAALR